MSALKNLYSPSFYNRLSAILTESIPGFDKAEFIRLINSDGFENKELKERMRHTAIVLHHFMPKDFALAVDALQTIIENARQANFGEDGLASMFLPDYIEVYGLDHYDDAIKALEYVTQYTSCEFAVRPFLIKYPDQMMKQMQAWSLHDNYKVRRFASEGARPRLPWAMAIPHLKKDPSAVLPILENLKNDPSEFVRRSVANNINDIAKDHPDVVIDIAKKWKGYNTLTDAIVKHGSRTLLKQGHAEILKIYGLDAIHIEFSDFEIITPVVKMGDSVTFTFGIKNISLQPQTVRLEYGMYYMKAKGQLAKKVFKISEKTYQPGEQAVITRNQSFKAITTRVFYPGEHQLSIIINGQEKEPVLSFNLAL
ncbi:DNA alkylation repair protein [Flavobacterium sp. NRK1]|jgi:3-methyladenine DNA glycosylase AlkC|uniref:DNA alkylation repair protein n=1 Tax=Flavobacterium sp. NRK1 TaxID=2954929 RepID=UPI002093BDDE|nr:DNA alkylation repair protein [Flavobacterium sp. NRK1]MCO6147974.1 DNA alkylation repair protein [Flavobacterium sp. NRK1]